MPVPEHGVLLDRQLLDGSVRKRSMLKHRHLQLNL